MGQFTFLFCAVAVKTPAAVAAVAIAVVALARWTRRTLWGAGLLGLYALSLAILELSEALGSATVQAAFQRGHTAVSAVWALHRGGEVPYVIIAAWAAIHGLLFLAIEQRFRESSRR